jgi:RHS repeat-associated protein
VACHDFLPFGEEISSGSSGYGGRTATCFTEAGSTTDGTAQRFTGKERDAELAGSAMQGLDYFGARYFSGAQGRWTSPDPSSAGLNIANPQSWNLYNYVLNNPLRLVDNNGLWATDVHAQIVTYSLQQYVSAGELNTLRARQYSMDADQSDQIRHAMANQGQSSLDALNAMWQFVASQMGVASQNVGSGGALDATGIGALGAAIHTVEDYTSPMHTDSNFMPLVWTGDRAWLMLTGKPHPIRIGQGWSSGGSSCPGPFKK